MASRRWKDEYTYKIYKIYRITTVIYTWCARVISSYFEEMETFCLGCSLTLVADRPDNREVCVLTWEPRKKGCVILPLLSINIFVWIQCEMLRGSRKTGCDRRVLISPVIFQSEENLHNRAKLEKRSKEEEELFSCGLSLQVFFFQTLPADKIAAHIQEHI